MRDFKEYTILDAVTPQAITSSTDATPIVVTKASHGLATGDLIMIYGHATNVAANGVRRVTVLNSSTFSLQDPDTDADIAGSGAGAGGGTGIFFTAPKIPLISDFRNAVFSLHTTSSLAATIKVAGSIGKTDGNSPNFGATQSPSNPYTFLNSINLEDGAAVEGDTGIVSAGTDLNQTYEVNINGIKYLTIFPTAWTAGVITVKLQVFSNE